MEHLGPLPITQEPDFQYRAGHLVSTVKGQYEWYLINAVDDIQALTQTRHLTLGFTYISFIALIGI